MKIKNPTIYKYTEKTLFKGFLNGNLLHWYNLDDEIRDAMEYFGWFHPFVETCRTKRVRKKRTVLQFIQKSEKYDYHFEGGKLWKHDIKAALQRAKRL